MIFTIKSTNPNMSYILNKNPNSNMLVTKMYKGLSHIWFEDETTIISYFKDSINENSFNRKNEFNYLDSTRFSSSKAFITVLVNNFKNSFRREQHELDIDNIYTHTLTINTLNKGRVKLFDRLISTIKDVDITETEIDYKTSKVSFTTNKSIHYLLNAVYLVGLINAIQGEDYIDFSDDLILASLNSLKMLEPDFYLRSIYSQFMLSDRKYFNKFGKLLNTDTIKIKYGNTQRQRKDFILESFTNNLPLIDIGSGVGEYCKLFSQDVPYIVAVERDPEVYDKLTHKMKYYNNVDCIKLIEDLEFEIGVETQNVLLTEVIEHNDLDEATELITHVLSTIQPKEFLITTPNKDFNHVYGLSKNEFRHDDHKWEMNLLEFKNYINSIVSQFEHYSVEFYNIGDSVNGVSTTMGCKITSDREIIPYIKIETKDTAHPTNTSTQANRNQSTDDKYTKMLFKDGVKFLSGTVSPASSNVGLMQIEPLYNGLNHYAKKGVYNVVIQPKYMGSRCQVYFKGDDVSCFSRNGYKIEIDEVIEKAKEFRNSDAINAFYDVFGIDKESLVIIDTELMPWAVMARDGLIDVVFERYIKLLESEMLFLDKSKFNNKLSELLEAYDNADDKKTRHFKYVPRIQLQNTDCIKHGIKVFKKQMDLYTKDGIVEFKPFDIIYVEDNNVDISTLTHEQKFEILSDDKCLTIDLQERMTDGKLDNSKLGDIYEFYDNLVKNGLEGVMIKPNTSQLPKHVAPMIKIRNQDYLTIIYGADYKCNDETYKELIKKKSTGSRVGKSIKEHHAGRICMKEKPTYQDYEQMVRKFRRVGRIKDDPRL